MWWKSDIVTALNALLPLYLFFITTWRPWLLSISRLFSPRLAFSAINAYCCVCAENISALLEGRAKHPETLTGEQYRNVKCSEWSTLLNLLTGSCIPSWLGLIRSPLFNFTLLMGLWGGENAWPPAHLLYEPNRSAHVDCGRRSDLTLSIGNLIVSSCSVFQINLSYWNPDSIRDMCGDGGV